MLNEISQYKSIETARRKVVSRAWWGKLLFNGYKILSFQDKEI
jgi:hypothetical protein